MFVKFTSHPSYHLLTVSFSQPTAEEREALRHARKLEVPSPVEIAFDDKHLNGMTDEEFADFCQSWVDVYNHYEELIETAIHQDCLPLEELRFSVEEKENSE